jgi:DNA-binding transcriptional MerR regulator
MFNIRQKPQSVALMGVKIMSFYASDVVKITNVKRTRLQQWLEKGWISPSVQQAEGAGTRNVYSLNDLYTIAIFKQVTEMGLPRKLVADFLSKGVIDGTLEIEKAQFIMYVRDGEQTGAAIVKGYNIDFRYQLKTLGLFGCDSIFLINFHRIKNDIDARVKDNINLM